MSTYTNDELRVALRQPHLTDAQCEEFRSDLKAFLESMLDEIFGEY